MNQQLLKSLLYCFRSSMCNVIKIYWRLRNKICSKRAWKSCFVVISAAKEWCCLHSLWNKSRQRCEGVYSRMVYPVGTKLCRFWTFFSPADTISFIWTSFIVCQIYQKHYNTTFGKHCRLPKRCVVVFIYLLHGEQTPEEEILGGCTLHLVWNKN